MTAAAALLTLGYQPTARLELGEPMTPHGVLVRNAIVRAEEWLNQLAYDDHAGIAGWLAAARAIYERESRALHQGACDLELEAELAAREGGPTDAIVTAFWQLSHDRELARALWLSFRLRCSTWGAR